MASVVSAGHTPYVVQLRHSYAVMISTRPDAAWKATDDYDYGEDGDNTRSSGNIHNGSNNLPRWTATAAGRGQHWEGGRWWCIETTKLYYRSPSAMLRRTVQRTCHRPATPSAHSSHYPVMRVSRRHSRGGLTSTVSGLEVNEYNGTAIIYIW
jgi:hypothetical protein